jgi:ribosomal-protein-alanine N-acetyltransferase
MTLEPAGADMAGEMADLHALCFEAPWSAADIGVLLDGPGGYGLVTRDVDGNTRGFLLARTVADEAEILTLAVDPGRRRQGLALGLVEAASNLALAIQVRSLLLEVAADNPAAIGLYRRAGFIEVGRRRGYYSRAGRAAIDALIMRRDLNSRLA